LRKEDVNGEVGVLVTICGCQQANVAVEGADPEMKWTLTFTELDKPLVLNKTNIEACADTCGSDDTKDWFGLKVVLFEDPNVSFGGKRVGGIRVRKPRTQVTKDPVVPEKKTKPSHPDEPPF